MLSMQVSIPVTPYVCLVNLVRILAASHGPVCATPFQVCEPITNPRVERRRAAADRGNGLVETRNLVAATVLLSKMMSESKEDGASQQVGQDVFPIKVFPLKMSKHSHEFSDDSHKTLDDC